MTTTLEKSWLTYKEAQEYCGISRTRLWELLRDSKGKAAKDGARVRINRASLDEYLERQDYAGVVGKK
jgi:excisionase family DNA binding protein